MSVPDDEVAVEVDGVSIRKTVNDHQFETLAVVFDVRSDREDTVTVSLTDGVPGDIVEDDIGFHPEYGGQHWRAGTGQVTFGRTFEPGDQYTTVYGIRDFDGDKSELLGEPSVTVEVESGDGEEGTGAAGSQAVVEPEEPETADEEAAAAEVDVAGSQAEAEAAGGEEEVDAAEGEDESDAAGGVAGIDDLVSEDDSDPVREVIAGDSDSLPGMEAEAVDDVEPEPAPTEGAEDAAETPEDAPPGEEATEPEEPETADEEPAAAEADDEVTVPVTGGIARVLAKELRAGNVSYEDRQLLREELLPDEGSTDARIRSLQRQVADLTAYTEALEAFLDEEDGAEAVLGELRDGIDEVADDVGEVDEGLSAVEEDVADLETAVDGVAEDVQGLGGDLDAVSGDVDDVAGRVDGVERDVGAVQDELGRLDSVEGRLDRLEDDVAAIQDELTDLAAFRDRLSSVFGPGGGVGGGGAVGASEAVDDDEPGDDGPSTGGSDTGRYDE